MPVQPLDPATYHDPMFRVLAAQARNILRIEPGLEVGGANNDGVLTCIGPKPAIVKLYDTPANLLERNQRFEEHERIITLAPLMDQPAARIVGRKGRTINYVVACMVQLNREEQAQEVAEKGVDNLLARKADAMAWDWRRVHDDNIHLIDDGCPNGRVDDSDFQIEWSLQITWPRAMFIATVQAELYEMI